MASLKPIQTRSPNDQSNSPQHIISDVVFILNEGVAFPENVKKKNKESIIETPHLI